MAVATILNYRLWPTPTKINYFRFCKVQPLNCVSVKRRGRSHSTARLVVFVDPNDSTIPMETTILAQLGQATLTSLLAEVGGPTSMVSRHSTYTVNGSTLTRSYLSGQYTPPQLNFTL